MASAHRLKQSSMDAFLLPQPPSHDPVSASASASASAADYERIRQENILRNKEFFRKMGIAGALSTLTPPRPTKRPPKPSPPPSAPLRRSSRKRGLSPPSDEVSADPPKPSGPNFVDSSVFQYVCDDDASASREEPTSFATEPQSSPILGFRVVGKPFRDPLLSKIYSMDVRFLKKGRFLVAGGGHGGFISIYGGEDGREGGVDGEYGGSSERETVGPLMSWKGSRSWISGVRFAECNPMLLLSSSNDGQIVVWDIKRQAGLLSSGSLAPPVVAESVDLHSGGIFSMDQLNCTIATTSKDSTVGISRITSAGELVTERSVSGHHSGVIRGVCFGIEKDALADCGADGRICVLDTRLSHPCALTIKSQHSTAINMVQWSKTNTSLLLSASMDPYLLLYDIRRAAEPLHRLQGHFETDSRGSHYIYRPSFVDAGKAIATPGRGSRKISFYSVGKGELMSQGLVGYDANLVMCTRDDGERLWAAGRHIDQLFPTLHQP